MKSLLALLVLVAGLAATPAHAEVPGGGHDIHGGLVQYVVGVDEDGDGIDDRFFAVLEGGGNNGIEISLGLYLDIMDVAEDPNEHMWDYFLEDTDGDWMWDALQERP